MSCVIAVAMRGWNLAIPVPIDLRCARMTFTASVGDARNVGLEVTRLADRRHRGDAREQAPEVTRLANSGYGRR